jgi:hypothetical protein
MALPQQITELGDFDQVTYAEGHRHYVFPANPDKLYTSVTTLLGSDIPDFVMDIYHKRVGGKEEAARQMELMRCIGNLFDSAVQHAINYQQYDHPALACLGYPEGTKFYTQVALAHHDLLYMGTSDIVVECVDGTWDIVDTKAWSKFYSPEEEKEDEGLGLLDRTLSSAKIDKARKQLCLYALAFEHLSGIKPTNLQILHFCPHTFTYNTSGFSWQYQSNRTQKSIRETIIPLCRSFQQKLR